MDDAASAERATTDVRVVVVDDHAVVRAGIRRLLTATDGIVVVGDAADGHAACALVRELQPDVALMDLSMPIMDGVEATRTITAETPGTAVLVLTSFADHDDVLRALDAGASGYILKDCDPATLVGAVRSAAAGNAPLDARAARALLQDRRAPSRPVLSTREREVLEAVGRGLPNKLVARELGISEKTVKAHLTRVFQAIGVTDRTQAALWLQRNGAGDRG
ncbi:MAG: liaR 5 [Thermoleophilia bacterium]|nr:liaR 5 [Thermoleophilia bacterium]